MWTDEIVTYTKPNGLRGCYLRPFYCPRWLWRFVAPALDDKLNWTH